MNTIPKDARTLEEILREASTEEETVILTTLNRAWAEPNSTFELFLESFHIGQGTKQLLRHLCGGMYGRGSSLAVLGGPSSPLLLTENCGG
ncbi:unnamed protein product [Arabis nemorensis]|uniref:Uncharacterized protein n=1 Tax=Arabis nemorensis TaxID=586526 RepID=A0A565BLR2_9BRAS|nr:unnamed protein product [Arabis nemorensis]